MSLLHENARPCVLLRDTSVPDGAGGQYTVWEAGAAFEAVMALDTGTEAYRAGKEGARSAYTVLTGRAVGIGYGDYFRDTSTGQAYRVTSDPAAKQAPRSSALPLQCFTAEQGEVPE